MNFREISTLAVGLEIEGEARALGRLAWSGRERRAYFEFDADFLSRPLPVSPFHLKPAAGLVPAPPEPFEGLHGAFNDSLPDGWGRLLLDRRLQRAGLDPFRLTPVERLAAVGLSGMGALTYRPELIDGEAVSPPTGDLDWFVEQVDLVQQAMDAADIETLQGAQGGSAGARPKIMIGFHPQARALVLDHGQDLPPGFEPWMVKARSENDPAGIGTEEQAYALMARAAGIRMAETTVIETARGNRLFATRRFDRTGKGRLHMATASGLLQASHRAATLTYEHLHKLTLILTRDQGEVERMFRHMVFNVLARNRDDHAKNHGFLMDAQGRWTVSPAYDLTLSAGPGGEHSADIAGEGRNPGQSHMLQLARRASIPPARAQEIVGAVRAAVSGWRLHADEAGLSKARTMEIEHLLNG